MFQIMGIIDEKISGAFYSMVSGIYSFVAKVYDIMLDLAGRGSEAGSIKNFYLGNMATAMYTLAGVFMLFRVTISAVNMIINPDMVSDRNAGAGKILTRVITSLAMLIMFWPSGWIFGDDGILIRLENALLAEDGLINKLLPEQMTSTSESDNSKYELLTDNVYAAGETVDCYYFYKDKTATITQNGEKINMDSSKIKYNATKGLFHIRFYNQSSTNTNPNNGRAALCTKWDNNLFSTGSRAKNCSKFSFEIINDNINDLYRAKLPKTPAYTGVLIGTHFNSGWKNTCPHIISGGTMYYEAKTGTTTSYKTESSGIVGGWHSHNAMAAVIKEETLTTGDAADKTKAEESIGVKEVSIDNAVSSDDGDGVGLEVNNEAAAYFAQMAMGTFITCNSDEDDCASLKASILVNPSADKSVISGMASDPETIHLDFLPAIVAGIGILVWVVVLCVDVIVRRFKLMLLQMIAPIPIISYSDPNDKMFPQWGKMYVATYLDLFLKLLAIGFATALLDMVWSMGEDMSRPIEKFFYIVAILVFAKLIPSIISKVFGIDNLGGSFKDITGMGKAALGFGAGAAIGGAVGMMTGLESGASGRKTLGGKIFGGGVGALKGGFKGTARGAGAGAKGNITGGAKSISAENYRIEEARANGLSFMDRAVGRTQVAVGMNPKKKIEDKIKGKEFLKSNVNDVQNAVTDVEKSLEGTNVMKDLKNAFDRGQISADAYKSGMSQLAYIWDKGGEQSKDASGNNTGFYKTKIQIKDKDGNMYGGVDGLEVKAEAGFHEGYKSAVSRLNKTVATIEANPELSKVLTDKNENGGYELNFNPVDKVTKEKLEGFDKIQGIKGTTFGADSKLQEEIIELKNGPEMQKAQAIDSYGNKSQ